MSKHDSNPKRDPLDENVDELLAQMAAGKVITDDGAVSVDEIETRKAKPKPAFTGTELLDDGKPVPKPAVAPGIALDTPIADTGMGEDALAATAQAPATPEVPHGPLSDSVPADETPETILDSETQLTTHTPPSPEGNPLHPSERPVPDEAPTPENNLGQIPGTSINSAESAADENAPEVSTGEATDGAEPSGAETVVASPPNTGATEAGESVPELADQLESLLSGADEAGQQAGEELAVETLEVQEPAPAESSDATGAIDSLNAELEAAAAKVETTATSVESPAAKAEPATAAVEPKPTSESVAATQAPVEAPAAKVHDEPPAAEAEPATAAVEPKGPGTIKKLTAKAVSLGGNAALSALALASVPLKHANTATRDTIGWVGLWTAFLGACVWFYVLVLHTPAPPFVPAAAIRVVENSGEGGEGGGHGEKPAKKAAPKKDEGHAKASGGHEKSASKPAAKSGGHEAPGGGHEKPKAPAKPPAKPAAKPAKKSEGHGEAGGH